MVTVNGWSATEHSFMLKIASRIAWLRILTTATALFYMSLVGPWWRPIAYAQEKAAGSKEAKELLAECVRAQRAFERISFKTVAEIYYSHGGKEDVQKSEARIRRDGDRMDSVGKYI